MKIKNTFHIALFAMLLSLLLQSTWALPPLPRRHWDKYISEHPGENPPLMISLPIDGARFSDREIRYAGCTDPAAKVTLNGKAAYVYPTGAFAGMIKLNPGKNYLTFVSVAGKCTTRKTFTVYGPKARTKFAKRPVTISGRDYILPREPVELMAGDSLHVRFRGSPGCKAWFTIGESLAQHPMAESGSEPNSGDYSGDYVIAPEDIFTKADIRVFISGAGTGKKGELQTISSLAIGDLTTDPTSIRHVIETLEDDTALYSDRTKKNRLTSVPSGTRLETCGRQGEFFRVRLSGNEKQKAWILRNLVHILDPSSLLALAPVQSINLAHKDDWSTVSIVSDPSSPLPFQINTSESGTTLSLLVYGLQGRGFITSEEAAILDLPFPHLVEQMSKSNLIRNVKVEPLSSQTLLLEVDLGKDGLWGYKAVVENEKLDLALRAAPELHPSRNRPLAGLKVMLDAGHGGKDGGTIGAAGLIEADFNQRVVDLLAAKLMAGGATVLFTHSPGEFMNLEDRVRKINNSGADLFLCIHSNSISEYMNPFEWRGLTAFYTHPFQLRMAEGVVAALENRIGDSLNINPVKIESLRLTRLCTNMPGVLVEVLYLSSPEEEMMALDPVFVDRIADGLCRGVFLLMRNRENGLNPSLALDTKE